MQIMREWATILDQGKAHGEKIKKTLRKEQ